MDLNKRSSLNFILVKKIEDIPTPPDVEIQLPIFLKIFPILRRRNGRLLRALRSNYTRLYTHRKKVKTFVDNRFAINLRRFCFHFYLQNDDKPINFGGWILPNENSNPFARTCEFEKHCQCVYRALEHSATFEKIPQAHPRIIIFNLTTSLKY